MEHKLIQGGERFLPFARSRIARLRAAGVSYGCEQFEVDGVSIKVRLDGEHEYIRLIGGQLPLAMDSGIVDLVRAGGTATASYARGILKNTTSTLAYIAGWTAQASGKYSGWLANKPTIPHGQAIGTITFPPVTGHVRSDGVAASFIPKRVALVPPPADPAAQQWKDDPKDEGLAAKKVMATSCPASVFTGRTRLYVQAMFGRPLYRFAGQAIDAVLEGTGRPALGSTNPPTLSLPAYKRPDDTITYPSVVLGTSAGVRFEPATGEHWLILVTGANLTLYPLISSSAGEAVRKQLLSPTLNADDKAKLEAYVLAYCLPDVKNAFTVGAWTETPNYSMGYGWHWNMSGTAADIITTTQFAQDATNNAMESTHRRITLTRSGAVTDKNKVPSTDWSASKATIQAPTRWAVSRLYWCLAEPEWATMAQLKSTPKFSTLFACQANVYAFYAGDVLKLLNVKVDDNPATPGVRTSSVTFAGPELNGIIYEQTAGLLNGYCYDTDTIARNFTGTFACAGVTLASLPLSRTTTSRRVDLAKNDVLGFSSHVAPGTFQTGGVITRPIGYLSPFTDNPQIEVLNFSGSTWAESNEAPPTISSTKTKLTRSKSETSVATIIVPFFDAEAVFISGAAVTDTADSGIVITTHATQGLAVARSYSYFHPGEGSTPSFITWDPAMHVNFIAGGPGGVLTTSTPPSLTTHAVTGSTSQLAYRGGAAGALMVDLDSYHDGNDYAQVNYMALCGTSLTSPVAIDIYGHVTPTGFTGPVPNFPALVGWV